MGTRTGLLLLALAAACHETPAPPLAGAFVGRAVSEVDGSPVAGAEVEVRYGREQVARLATDERGFFVLGELRPPSGFQNVLIRAAGYVSGAVSCEGDHATEASARVVALRPTAPLTVRLSARGGLALAGADVHIELPRTSVWWDSVHEFRRLFPAADAAHSWSAITDEAGEARFDALPASTNLRLRLPWTTEPLTLDPFAENTLELEHDAFAVAGRVVNNRGRPLEDLWLVLHPADTSSHSVAWDETDADGRFLMFFEHPGAYEIHGPGPDCGELGTKRAGWWFEPAVVRVDEANPSHTLEIVARRGVSVEVQVVDLDGLPHVATIDLRDRDGRRVRSCETNRSRFTLHGVGPDGLLARAVEEAPLPDHRYIAASAVQRSLPVSVDPTDESVLLRVGGHRLVRARWSDEVDAQPGESSLWLTPTSLFRGAAPERIAARAAEDGAIEVRVLPGTYRLFARSPGGAVAVRELQVDASREPLEIELEPVAPATLELRNADGTLAQWRLYRDGFELDRGQVPPGSVATSTFPAGDVVLEHRLLDTHVWDSRSFALEANAERTLELGREHR